MIATMTVTELRNYTLKNTFDTIVINGKPKAEYQARQYLFKLDDQEQEFDAIVDDGVLFLYNQNSFDA